MAMSAPSSQQATHQATTALRESDGVLGDLTEALARGEVGKGTRLLERALLLDVQWEQLTMAVQAGISQGYDHPGTVTGMR